MATGFVMKALPGWHPEEWQAETAGTVTSITAGAGISVTGTAAVPIITNTGVISVTAGTGISLTGTATNPVINIADVIAGGTFGAIPYHLLTPTINDQGQIIAITEHPMPWAQSFSFATIIAIDDNLLVGNSGPGAQTGFAAEEVAHFPAPWGPFASHTFRIRVDNWVPVDATDIVFTLLNQTAVTSVVVATVHSTDTFPLDIVTTVSLAFVEGDLFALQISNPGGGNAAFLAFGGTSRSVG